MVCRCRNMQEHADRQSSRDAELRCHAEQAAKKNLDAATARIRVLESQLAARVDNTQYTVCNFYWAGAYLVLTVQYPSCQDCAYEGTKILVYKDVANIDLLNWREIDPHFREPQVKKPSQAPSPIARFPASVEGEIHARMFVNALVKNTDEPRMK